MKGVNLVHDPNAQYEYRCCQSLVMMEVLVNEQGALTALFVASPEAQRLHC